MGWDVTAIQHHLPACPSDCDCVTDSRIVAATERAIDGALLAAAEAEATRLDRKWKALEARVRQHRETMMTTKRSQR